MESSKWQLRRCHAVLCGLVSEWSKSLRCWRASRLLSLLFVFHLFVEQLINQWAALSNKIITTDMTVFCWGPVLSVYSSIGLERQSTFQSVLYYSWKTKELLGWLCFCISPLRKFMAWLSKRFDIDNFVIKYVAHHDYRKFWPPKWRVATVAMVVNEINVHAATGLYTN